MKHRISTAVWFVLLCATAATGAAAQQPLTLRQAIAEALGANPEARQAEAATREASAQATLARTALLPQLNFTEDISRGDDPVYAFGSRLRQQAFTQADFALNALNKPQPIGNFATRLSGQWLAFDSFQTQKRIRAAGQMQKSAAFSAQAANQKIVLDVVSAYQAVLYAERRVAVAQQELETAQALLASVDDHVQAGLAVESDRMSAEVNMATRQQEQIAAEGNLEIAWAQLRVAMGAPELPETALAPIAPHSFPPMALDAALQTAYKTRPDLAAVDQAQSAEAAALSAAKLGFGPRISAYGNWEQDRPTFAGAGGNNWVAGVQLTLDIAPIAKRAQLADARAARDRIDAQRASYRQQVQLQVTEAEIALRTAELSVATAEAARAQSAESLRILRNRYGAGLATITDLLRAEDAERASQNNYWQAVYGNAVAYAQLLFATGTLSPDAAEELQ